MLIIKKMKVAIITNHYVLSPKQTNIHCINDILDKNYDIDWFTYPVSISILRKRNRYKLYALIRGFNLQYFIFTPIPKYILKFNFLRNFLSFEFKCRKVTKFLYDIVIVEGVQPSYVYSNFNFRKLIVRASDDLGYLDLFSDEVATYESMVSNADQVWAVLRSTTKKYENAIYLPNPSIYDHVIQQFNYQKKEAVYVGSNKCDNQLLIKLADSGIIINMYTEDCKLKHKNIILHDIISKKDLALCISEYKVGLIPFLQNDQNKYMEIPLKTYDYIAAGLHVVMISSSSEVNTEIIQSASSYDEFIALVHLNMERGINVEKYNHALQERGVEWFSTCIKKQLSLL